MYSYISLLVLILVDVGDLTFSPSGPIIKHTGETFTLKCSVDISPYPLPQNVPFPILEFFGPTNTSLSMSDVTNIRNIYASTLHFFSLQESHAGMYACQLGKNKNLAASIRISTCS